MAEEKDQSVSEKPATYSKKGQNIAVGVVVGVFVLLIISVMTKMGGNDKPLFEQTRENVPTVQRESPQQQTQKLNDRINRAEESLLSPDAGRKPLTVEEVVRNVRNPTTGEAGQVPASTIINEADLEWQQSEKDRVRNARYSDYEINLGFRSQNPGGGIPVSAKQDPRAARIQQLRQGTAGNMDGSIAAVNDQIAQVSQFRDRLLSGDQSAVDAIQNGELPTLNSLPMPARNSLMGSERPRVPQVVGTTKSNSPAGPAPGTKLLPISSIIRAALDFETISDYPGPFRAIVVTDVYDIDNRNVLIPKGTKIDGQSLIVGNINEPISARMGLAINWMILPNGDKIDFSRQAVLDRAGVAAIKDKVNRHFIAQFFGVAAYALVSSESQYQGSGALTDSTFEGDVSKALRQQLAPHAQKYLNLVPTKTLRSGTPLRIYITEEMFIKPWRSLSDSYAIH